MNDTRYRSTTHTSASRTFRVFFRIFLAVWLLVVFSATLITFLLPEAFMAVALVRSVSPPGRVLEQLHSNATLIGVAERLHLETDWSNRYAGGEKLEMNQVLMLLKARVVIRPISADGLIEIKAFSGRPQEAAQIANALAEEIGLQVKIVDRAVPVLRPVRPNKPLNIAFGALVGAALGCVAGLIGVLLSRGIGTRSRGPAPSR